MEQKSANLFDLHLDQQSQGYLSETAKWAKFLSILGFIMIGLFFILILVGGAAAFSSFDELGYYGNFGAAEIIIFLVIMALAVIPYIYLYRFAVKMQVALRNNDQANLTSSFSNLKSCYKYVGIFTIVILSFYLILFIYGILRMGMAGF
ncbi:MAG TPA: hypothetical protein VFZ47_06245 [Chitinophagaceae bacterium]